MNEQELGKGIAKLLDVSANENIKQSTLYRLQCARRAALENCQPTFEIINSGNGASIYGEHDSHFHFYTGKLIWLLIMLFAFALVSTTYWQFLEKSRSSIDDTVLVDDLSTVTTGDNEQELMDDLSIEAYIDNESELVDDVSADVDIDNESENGDGLSTDILINEEPELDHDVSEGTSIENEPELTSDLSINVQIDNGTDELLGTSK